MPEAHDVGADLGVVVLKSAPPVAQAHGDFLLAPTDQTVLARHSLAPR